MTVSIVDVARLAGVSISTVSNVLSGKKAVSDELSHRVRMAAKTLDYRPNPMARGLKNKKTHTIGVIITTFQSLFFGQVLRGIQDTVVKNGIMVNVFESNNSLANERRYVSQLANSLVDGILLLSLADYNNPEDISYLEEIGRLSVNSKPIPVVGLERTLGPANSDAVVYDNRSAAAIITKHLTDIGHRKIAHIAGQSNMEMSQLRLRGYKEGLVSAGIRPLEEWIMQGDYTPSSGYLCMHRIMRKTKCTAVFAANDQMAIGAIKAIREKGLRIPEDIAIAGFDNIFAGTLIKPSLTTIDVPRYEMGSTAARMLVQRMSGRLSDPGKKVVLDTKLIIRQSTDADIEQSWDLSSW